MRNKPIIADVTVTVTSETPWGPYTQTQSGKYWRSRDGKTRRDDGFGHSYITGLNWWRAEIDHDAKMAYEFVHNGPPDNPFAKGSSPPALNDDPAGLSAGLLEGAEAPRKLVRIGEKQIEGRKVTGRRSEGVAKGYPWGPNGDRWTYEVWTANDLKLAVEFQYKTRLMKVVQRFENIQERDPDPEVFRIPKGYRVRTAYDHGGAPPSALSNDLRPLFGDVHIQK